MDRKALPDTLRFDRKLQLERLGSRLERSADVLACFGLLQDGVFAANFEAWCKIGTPPERLEEEFVDEWALLQADLACLVEVESQQVRLESVGHVGAVNGAIAMSVDGWRVDEANSFTSWRGPALPIPIVAFLSAEVRRPASTREAQLGRWANVRKHVDLVREHLPSLLTIELDQHLENLVVRTPERFGLRWTPSQNNREIVSLDLTEDRDGNTRTIDLGALDPETGVVSEEADRPILLPEPVLQVAKRARKLQRQIARKVAAEIADPARVIPEGVDADAFLCLDGYADRVLGFERVLPHRQALRFQPQPAGEGWYAKQEGGPFLRLTFAEPQTGTTRQIDIAQPHDAELLLKETTEALARNGTRSQEPVAVTFAGQPIVPEPALCNTLNRALLLHRERLAGDHRAPEDLPKPIGRLAAVLGERDASPIFDADGLVIDESSVPWHVLNTHLAAGVSLKQHQIRGVAWLWHHRRAHEPGVLLADDMGLGKTLQVAAFLALRGDNARNKPNLIVAPTILLPNWIEEIERFFKPTVFGVPLVLHDETLRALRREKGELEIGKIASAGLVLTNYETLASHQLSLLRIDFSNIVFDEAQAVKNESTLRSRAARGLKREFAIAMTGTPVENRLSDLWSICDALQPDPDRRAFGPRASFEREYEQEGPCGIAAVRQRLHFPSQTSIVLRREKAQALRELPPKQYHSRPVEMTHQQYEEERVIAREMQQRGPLGILNKLRSLYQHPALLNAKEVAIDPEGAVKESPKTAETLRILEGIEARQEKAIVFTHLARMQELLVLLFKTHFDLPRVNIINGNPQRRSRAKEIIADFSATPGFDVLVLSPLAAGAGLTITAANHVIHYGRWWNPAKEDQATDRAHRIGQTRPVHVYYPILHHPGNPDGGFDIKLHRLVEKKRDVARDFLAPAEDAGLGKEVESLLNSPVKDKDERSH